MGTGVLLREIESPRDMEIPGLRDLNFQAVIKDPEYPDGKAKAEAVSAVLTIDQRVLGGSYFYWVRPVSEPIPFGREAVGTNIFVVNFKAKWRL